LLLIYIGAFSVVSALIGVLAWAVEVEGVWETVAVLLFGAPVVVLLATWPIALGQLMRAVADMGDELVGAGRSTPV
jgi:hypothetical protein